MVSEDCGMSVGVGCWGWGVLWWMGVVGRWNEAGLEEQLTCNG